MTRAIRSTAPRSSGTGSRSPSAYPFDQATPALVVATARAPSDATSRALIASQTFARTRIPSSCRRRNSAAAGEVLTCASSGSARPEVLGGVRAPGPPRLRPRQQVRRRRPRARAVGGAAQQADVARGERVRLAQRADRDVLRGPLADAADGAQARDRL